MPVIFLFIDGVGLGEATESNPLYSKQWSGFNTMTGGEPLTKQTVSIRKNLHVFVPVDATLGVDGLPQSGTGQTTLFSGQNAAKEIGKHFGPFPHSGIKHLLRRQSLFHKAQDIGKSCAFINAYPEIFFKKAQERDRWSCTTLMSKSAGIILKSTDDVKQGEAITAGITQQAWRDKLNLDVPRIAPSEAANRLIKQSVNNDLVLYEYYLTDKAGHSQESRKAMEVLQRYDEFVGTLLKNRPENTTVVLCSDHGNIEDLSTKTHTYNQVPLFAKGPGAGAFKNARSIMDVTPGIIKILEKKG